MNILLLRNLFIFILFSLGQPSFAQSINDANLQKLLIESQSKINNIPEQDTTTFGQQCFCLVLENYLLLTDFQLTLFEDLHH